MPPQKLPKRPSIPTPNLPSKKIPEKSFKKPSDKKRIIILSVLAFVIILFIIGEIWWFFIRPEPAPIISDPLPSPEEVAPEVSEPPVAEELQIPLALLNYNQVQTINLQELSSFEFLGRVG